MTDETERLLPVAQEDRDAAADTYLALGYPPNGIASLVRKGAVDEGVMAQAFARHRLAATRQQDQPADGVVEALERIANPIAAMQRDAEAEGNRLSNMAYQIANDPHYLQEIARKALAQHKESAS